MARTMINEYGLPQYLWAEAVNTSCYISNRVFFCKNTSKTSFTIQENQMFLILKFLVVNVLF